MPIAPVNFAFVVGTRVVLLCRVLGSPENPSAREHLHPRHDSREVSLFRRSPQTETAQRPLDWSCDGPKENAHSEIIGQGIWCSMKRQKLVRERMFESIQNSKDWKRRKDKRNEDYYLGYYDALVWVLSAK
jgi:hypothetical protein